MKALNLSDKPKGPNHQVYNINQQQQEYEKPNDRKKLYEANHLCKMNSIYYNEICKKTTSS